MFTNALVSASMALPLLAMAAPTPQQTETATADVYLRTKVVSGYTSFENLYPETHHIGAAENDLVMNTTTATSFLGNLDDGRWTSQVASNTGRYSLDLIVDESQPLNPVDLNAGTSGLAGAFSYNSTTGSLWFNSAAPSTPENSSEPYMNQFGGWVVCNVTTEPIPQLFWLNTAVENTGIDKPCADVYLLPQTP